MQQHYLHKPKAGPARSELLLWICGTEVKSVDSKLTIWQRVSVYVDRLLEQPHAIILQYLGAVM